MSGSALQDLERRLEGLPREAWDRPVPPPPPWPGEAVAPRHAARGRLVLRPVAVAVASIALVGAGVGAGLLLAGGDDATAPGGEAVQVELEPLGESPPGAAGTVELEPRAGGTATVTLEGLRPSEGGYFYELWLLGADGELVSLGSVRVPESGRATLENVQIPVDPRRFRSLDVSLEPDDGDPGHSAESVLRGPSV